MRVTIVCEDEHVLQVREKAKELIPNHITLKTPLSPTGKFPQTHWFCTCFLTNDGFNKLIELKKYSMIYCENPKKVLKEINLKIIK